MLLQETCVWDAATGHAIGVPLAGHAAEAVTTSYSPDGSLLATSALDGRIIVRDARTGQQLGVPLRASDATTTMASFDRDGRPFLGSTTGTMWLLDKFRGSSAHVSQLAGE